MEDISFQVDNHKFNYRVAAIIEYKQRYLLTTAPGLGFWFLPGGRVKVGEASLQAIERELAEELGIKNQAVQLLWVVENFFALHGQNFHEMSFYFFVSLPQNTRLAYLESFLTEPDFEFQWFNAEAIQSLDLRPRFLKVKLPLTDQAFRHIIFRDNEHYVEFDPFSNRTR